MAALGMGVGHVRGSFGPGLSRQPLRRFRHHVARDADSAERLHRWGWTTPPWARTP